MASAKGYAAAAAAIQKYANEMIAAKCPDLLKAQATAQAAAASAPVAQLAVDAYLAEVAKEGL